jgi:hypothetical protein
MNEKIRNHIDTLFDKAPKTRKAFELKEELLANSEERYQDLVANGVAPEDAIKNVINSIGNVTELFRGLDEINENDREEWNAYVKKAAMFKTVAAGIYLFSVVVVLFFLFIYQPFYYNSLMLGIVIAILIDIIPTCMLIYITNLAPKYKRSSDTVVEDFKEWSSKSQKSRSVKKLVIAVLWSAIVPFYFFVSFITMAWYATWILFFVALCIHAIIELIFQLKEQAIN